MEELSALVKRAKGRWDIHGVKVCRVAPSVNHLLFANDCYLFFPTNDKECLKVQHLLQLYGTTLGQVISYLNFEIQFSRNCNTRSFENLVQP